MANFDKQQEREMAQVRECLNIITYKHNSQVYHNRSEARTRPNQRPVEVFGIKNSSTDEDTNKHRGFRTEAITKMRNACKMSARDDTGDWPGVRQHAIDYCNEYMQRDGNSSIKIAELVQFVTLKLSLSYLYTGAEIASDTTDTFEDVKFIGHQINDLWIGSKRPDGERPQWADQHNLHKSLRRVTNVGSTVMPGSFPEELFCGTEPTIPEENPLNLLLPAYETMWRVVLRCFVEVRLRNAVNSSEWQLVLTRFLDELRNPDCMPLAFHKDSAENLRPSDFAKEALRLYPPSRHVHREFNGVLHRADIETCHRSELLGRDDPLVFRPERWQDICLEERAEKVAGLGSKAKTSALKNGELELGFMPFTTYCAADKTDTRAFAMKMIVMLVAVLCSEVGEDWGLADADSLPERGVPLDSDRAAYEGLVLRRM